MHVRHIAILRGRLRHVLGIRGRLVHHGREGLGGGLLWLRSRRSLIDYAHVLRLVRNLGRCRAAIHGGSRRASGAGATRVGGLSRDRGDHHGRGRVRGARERGVSEVASSRLPGTIRTVTAFTVVILACTILEKEARPR